MKLEVPQMDEWMKELELLAIKKAAFDCNPDPTWIKKFDPEKGRFIMLFINKAYVKKTQIKYDDYVGNTDFDIHPIEDAEKYHENDMKVYLSGEAVFDYEPFDGYLYPMSKAPYVLNDHTVGIIGSIKIDDKFKKEKDV